MRLSESQSIILFRFHKDSEQAQESIRRLQYYNPDIPVHAFFGGPPEDAPQHRDALQGSVASFWCYPHEKEVVWKWKHTDLLLKEWYRAFGHSLSFDFVFSYEYDLLTIGSLRGFYPDIEEDTLALAACEEFTNELEKKWSWTGREDNRPQFLSFQEHMNAEFGLIRQKKVSLGPGPLFPRTFLEAWSRTKDVELVNDEIAYPAYAEALGFKLVDHGMHAGFFKDPELTKYFNCNSGRDVTTEMLKEQLALPGGRRSFHPVRFALKHEDISVMLQPNT